MIKELRHRRSTRHEFNNPHAGLLKKFQFPVVACGSTSVLIIKNRGGSSQAPLVDDFDAPFYSRQRKNAKKSSPYYLIIITPARFDDYQVALLAREKGVFKTRARGGLNIFRRG